MRRLQIPTRLSALFLLITSVGAAAAQTKVDSSRILRVLTYNIFHGETLNHDFDLDLIADVIRAASPDLVALQEVDFKTRRVNGRDLVLELGMRTAMAPLFCAAMEYDGGEYGVGILSRYSFISSRCHPLPHSPGHEPRAALEARIRLPAGDEVLVVDTHWDHTIEPQDRLFQAQRVNELFGNESVPTILAGDLNDLPDSKPVALFREAWIDACGRDPQPTFPSVAPERRIDYLLVRPPYRWRVLECRVIDERVASDHRPVLAVLELLPTDPDQD